MTRWHRPSIALIALGALAGAILVETGAAETAGGSCAYEISLLDPGAERLSITVECTEVSGISGFRAEADRKFWHTDAEQYAKDRGRFDLDLGGMARATNDFRQVMIFGAGILVAPELLLPLPQVDGAVTLEIRFLVPEGSEVITAIARQSDGTHVLSSRNIGEAGPVLLGTGLSAQSLTGDPALRLVAPDRGMKLSRQEIEAWVSAAAQSNRRFWGQSPAPGGLIVVVPALGRGDVPFGRVLSAGGAVVTIRVGEEADGQALLDDWVLTHELLHLGSPVMRDTGTWLNEGIATFYEPLLRVRAGWKPEDEVWREWISQMPRGMRAMTDIGLSNAGRGGIYWGGAIFVLMAEIEALSASGGQVGFSDCLRRALGEGGNTMERWPSRKLIDLCDRMLGGDRLARLHEAHVAKGSPMDLDETWRRLGVAMAADGAIAYDDTAELAWVRPLILWGGPKRPEPISSAGFHHPE